MVIKNKRLLFAFGTLLVIVAVLLYFSRNTTIDLVIVHTNDHHGYGWSIDNKGGFAKQLTLIKRIRKENHNVLLLSGGDINTGYPESDVNQGEPSFKGMKLLGFDAMVVGNHEFDISLPVLRQQETWGGFPFLSANIYHKGSGERVFTPYVIKIVGPLKVALLGLTTEQTSYTARFVEGLDFKDPMGEAKNLISDLKKQADLIIALTHIGIPSERHRPIQAVTDFSLARENPGIRVIVGGHSHSLLKDPIKEGETLILQAYQYAQNMGELHLKIRRSDKKIVSYEYMMHDLDESIPEDTEMVSVLEPYLQKTKVLFDEKVGETAVDLNGEREVVRSQETNLGNLVTDLFRNITKADIAIQNGGGIRASIEKGNISFRDVLKAFPFHNTIVVLNLTGQEISEILNYAVSLPRPAGGFLQVSGLSFEMDGGYISNVRVNGSSLSLERVYSVATNDFVANGGDGYEMLKNKQRIDTGFVISGVLKNYLMTKKTIAPKVENRIVVH